MTRPMKDSGIEWIGEIPQGWNVNKLKYSADINRQRLNEQTDPDFEFNYIDISSVNEFGEIAETTKLSFEVSPSRARMVVNKGDTIVSTVRTYLKAIAYIDKSESYICSTGFCVLSPYVGIDSKYLYYQVQSDYFVQRIVSESVGVSYSAINSNRVGEILIIVPSLSEQKAIANYLDQKCAQIDKVIASKQKTNELLKERRQSIIYEAVTKGLDRNALMKDSGIEWIGAIPQGWNVRKLKYSADINNSKLSGQTDPDYEFEYIDIGSVTEFGEIVGTTKLSFEKSPSRARMVVQKGDTIVSTVRTYLKAIAHINESASYICSTGFCVLSPLVGMDSKYLYYQTQSDYFVQRIVSESVGVSYPAISSNRVGEISIVVPNINEQKAISNYLDDKCGEIDRLIRANNFTIEKLIEYRQSIIFEAVTGKMEVPRTCGGRSFYF